MLDREEAALQKRDGTYRGGRRVKAGSKPDPLVDKIAAGKEANILRNTTILIRMPFLLPMSLKASSDLYG